MNLSAPAEAIGGTNASGVSAGGTRTFEYLDAAALAADLSGRFAGLPPEVVGGVVVTQRDGAVKGNFVNGLAHHIVTPFTSLVAVDRSRVFGDGAPRLVAEPTIFPERVDLAMAGASGITLVGARKRNRKPK